ncbi:MAG: hypothetical protein HQ522_13785 [Bacteroidetes bacterium]|nr:hypothetical protein [Bacteroidota bacterium]
MNKSKIQIITIFLITILLGSCVPNSKHEFDTKTLETILNEIPYAKTYDGHLQGMATDFNKYIYWSHTRQLVKTDLNGNVLKVIDVQNHHGDLEYYKGKIYVAVNFGKFNEEPGLADSWVYIYDTENLDFIEKYPVPEVVHGAGGIAIHNNQVMVVGGLPENGNYNVNFVYEYNMDFNLIKRHVLAGGYTYKGIQTASFFNEYWYFACYGSDRVGVVPKVLKVRQTVENKLELVQSVDIDMSYGMIGQGNETFITSNRNLDAKATKMKLLK